MKTNSIILLLIGLLSFSSFAQDTDGDGVLDSIEGTTNDTDADGILDYLDIDDDNDGVNTIYEVDNSDGDGDPTTGVVINTDGDSLLDYLDVDDDGDGIYTINDNCKLTANPAQIDTDNDGIGDICDADIDNDGVLNIIDNCPNTPNTDQEDTDSDAIGDVCDDDIDGDGILNDSDNCPSTYNPGQEDINNDGVGNVCDYSYDEDGDGVSNMQESIDGTDILNPCDFIMASQTLTPTVFCNINTITGSVKLDLDNNGCDASDLSLENILVTSTDGTNSYSTVTDSSGDFVLHTDSGNYTTTASNYSLPNYFTLSPNSYSSNFVGANNTDNVDFCALANAVVNDLSISISPSRNPRPGFTVSYDIIYKNIGTTTQNGSVDFTFDAAKLQFLSASETIASQTTTTLNFNYTNLVPTEIRIITLNFQAYTIPTTNVGDIINFTANVTPAIGDYTPSNNTITFAQTVVGSYDPNDITVLEGAEITPAQIDKYLHYTIRFQNTGTADAINIVVTNELDADLDWDTFQIENRSHAGDLAIHNGNQIEFIFNNIHLPDSTSNEAASHGYIVYKIKPKATAALGDVFTNLAKIYFDYNPAIITNTATTTVVATAAIEANAINTIRIYPNPAKSTITLDAETTIIAIEILDILGKPILSHKNQNGIQGVNISKLPPNLYILKAIDENAQVTIQKLIVK